MSLLVVSRYLPEDVAKTSVGEPILDEVEQRDDALDDFNHPRYRRAMILHELKRRQEEMGSEFVKPDAAAEDCSSYRIVQSPDLIEFFSTAWERWDDLGPEGQDPMASLRVAAESATIIVATPPLIPGNVPLPREPYQQPSRNVMGQMGYYCTETGTPVFGALKEELQWDVAVMKRALDAIEKYKTVYALATHPGHHAAHDSFGGYCYLNHAAFCARQLQLHHGYSKVAVLDVDYHCGNGTASIFYEDPTVLVVSIHCHPDYDYPFHSGFPDQVGVGKGKDATLHLPLLPGTTWNEYNPALETAMKQVQTFGADALVVSMGLDTYDGDPCAIRRAGFAMSGKDYKEMGQWIGSYASTIPILVIQEGGYRMDKVPGAAADVLQSCVQSKS